MYLNNDPSSGLVTHVTSISKIDPDDVPNNDSIEDVEKDNKFRGYTTVFTGVMI
jgi:hypothetical protein